MVFDGVTDDPSPSVILNLILDELSPAVTMSASNVGCVSPGSVLVTADDVRKASLKLCITEIFCVSKLPFATSFVTT